MQKKKEKLERNPEVLFKIIMAVLINCADPPLLSVRIVQK